MATPSAKLADPQRRISDHGVVARKVSNHDVDRDRRRTMGATPVKNFTPSKHHQVNLGSAAASAYYFGDMPNTPHSASMKKHHTPAKTHINPSTGEVNEESKLDETTDVAETSMLSAGTSSSEGSDMMNKSILSDTTELTASNFVLQATSRQRLLELSRSTPPAMVMELQSKNLASEENLITFSPAQSLKAVGSTEKTGAPKPLDDASNRLSLGDTAGTPTSTNETSLASMETSDDTNAPVKNGSQEGPSPSMRSRLSSSPSSIRKLTSSLRKAKQQSDEERALDSKKLSLSSATSRPWSAGSAQHLEADRSAARTSSIGGISIILPPLTPASEHTTASGGQENSSVLEVSAQKEPIVAIATDKSLDDLLDDLKQDSELPTNESNSTKSRMSEHAQTGPISPSSTIASTSSLFRLPATPNSTSKLTSTRLEPSPGRILNPMMYSLRQATPHSASETITASSGEKKDESFSSPISTKADDESHFRLTPSSHKKLTPTKLSPDPRRVANPESLDSPARNTRSGKRKAGHSPSMMSMDNSMDIDSMQEVDSSEEKTGEKRNWDVVEEEVINSASLSRRRSIGRISDISMASSAGSKNKRRMSSISHSSAAENAGDTESVHSSSTASSADLDLLLGSMDAVKETDVSLGKGIGSRNVLPSPATHASIPRSILASAKMRDVPGSHSRKSVAFGSPEAAEYHIGDPSVSLTPMPPSTAKAMFSIPRDHDRQSVSSASSNKTSSEQFQTNTRESLIESGDETIEIETDMNALLQNVNAMATENISMSTTSESSDNQTIELESAASTTTISEGTDTEEIKKTLAGLGAENPSESSPSLETGASETGLHKEDETVELESNMNELLAQAFGSPTNESTLLSADRSNAMETSPADSLEMADAQSIASVSSQTDKHESSLDTSPQRLNFESNASRPSVDLGKKEGNVESGSGDQNRGTAGTQGYEEDNTIELEVDLATLLATAGAETAAMSREAPKPVTLAEKFPKLESGLAPRTNRMSFGEATYATSPQVTNGNVEMETADDSIPKGEVTKELESDMQSLIRATGDADTPSTSRRRSSHKFSLTPNSRLSLSTDGSITLNGTTAIGVESGDSDAIFAGGAKSEDKGALTKDDPDEVLELDSKEIMDAAGFPGNSTAIQNKNDFDTLSNANTASKNFRNPLIADAMRGFVRAVCAEIERKAELSSDGNSCFAEIADERPSQMLQLQRALRSHDGSNKSINELKRLAESVQTFVDFEWKSWEAQVIDSLVQSMDSTVADCEENDEALERSATLADDALEAVSLMEGRAVQKARRRSMNRRKTASQMLEAEIQELERQIERERANLEAIQVEQDAAAYFKGEINANISLSEEIKDARASAETLQTRFMSMKGMHCWSPVAIDESKIVVAFIGASPRTCIKVSYSFAKSGSVACHANVDSSFFRQRRGKKLKFTPGTLAFVEANVDALIETVSNAKLQSGGDIGESLQCLETMHGRLEMTANEIFVLQKRYSTIMEPDPVGKRSDFLVSVDFNSRSGSTTLRATFELTAAYPFAPLNVSLDDRDGKVELDLLRRQLTKNAKPGFGYLSRTCDTISAFLR